MQHHNIITCRTRTPNKVTVVWVIGRLNICASLMYDIVLVRYVVVVRGGGVPMQQRYCTLCDTVDRA